MHGTKEAYTAAPHQGNAPEIIPQLPGALSPISSQVASPPNLADIGPQVVGALATQYAALAQKGAYTPEAGAAVAEQLAPFVKAPVVSKKFSVADITLTNDTSYARMQKYQSDMRTALTPLSKHTTPEIAIVSAYIQTKDAQYAEQLRTLAIAYNTAVQKLAAIVVPSDASAQHIDILNAMGKFSAVLSAVAENASDPIVAMALLQTYNDAEAAMIVSFNSLALYISQHAS